MPLKYYYQIQQYEFAWLTEFEAQLIKFVSCEAMR